VKRPSAATAADRDKHRCYRIATGSRALMD
jgi:hypothetical protein